MRLPPWPRLGTGRGGRSRPPQPTGADCGGKKGDSLTCSYLSGVSCTSAKACTAVGYYDNGAGIALTMVEAWNGNKWTIEP
jgi:hypothetical protein